MISISSVTPLIDEFFKMLGEPEYSTHILKKETRYSNSNENISVFIDAYKGLHVVLRCCYPEQQMDLQKAIFQLFEKVREEQIMDALWIELIQPFHYSLLSVAGVSGAKDSNGVATSGCQNILANRNFPGMLKCWQWIKRNTACPISSGPNHAVGACALMIDTVVLTVLLVQTHGRKDSWNLPGGGFIPYEDYPGGSRATALRELQEETGIILEKDLYERLYNTATLVEELFFSNPLYPSMSQVWAFKADGLSTLPLKFQEEEIAQAKWFSIEVVLKCADMPEPTLEYLKVGLEIIKGLKTAQENKGFGFQSSGSMQILSPLY